MTVTALSLDERAPLVTVPDLVRPMRRALSRLRDRSYRAATRAAVVTRVVRYPRLSLGRSEEAAGKAIDAYLRARRLLPTLVLDLPEMPSFYLRGRRRQAVRTNIHKATALGLSSELATPCEARRLAKAAHDAGAAILHLRSYASEEHGPGMIDWIGRDADGAPIAFARVQIDGAIAMLKAMVAIRNDDRSVIRYMVSGHLFEHLALIGVRHVIVHGNDREPPGIHYFSARLGFEKRVVSIRC